MWKNKELTGEKFKPNSDYGSVYVECTGLYALYFEFFFILFYIYAFFLFEWWWEDAGNKLIKEVLFATIEFQLDANSQLYFVSRYEYIFIPHLQGMLI